MQQTKQQTFARWGFYLLGMVLLALGLTLNTKTGLGASAIVSVPFTVSQATGWNFGDLTLVVAMVPMLISNGEGAESRRSLAIVIVGGQALSLLITLLMTPVTYILMDEFGAWLNWKLRGIPIPEDKDQEVILPEVPAD